MPPALGRLRPGADVGVIVPGGDVGELEVWLVRASPRLPRGPAQQGDGAVVADQVECRGGEALPAARRCAPDPGIPRMDDRDALPGVLLEETERRRVPGRIATAAVDVAGD